MADSGERSGRRGETGEAGGREAVARRIPRTSGKVVGGRSGGNPLGETRGTGDGMQAQGTNKKEALAPVAVVRVEGNVDRAAIEACDYYISSSTEGTAGAVLDLSLATSFDREAAVVLVARRRVLKSKGRDLVVAAGLSDVRHAIRAHTAAEIQVFVTPEEALQFLRGGATAVGARTSGTQRRSR
jgi:anti-anti-sigma regulatory factor